MSFMDILLKTDSVSVYDVLKHQEIEEIRKQETVQDTIFQYLERRRDDWENIAQERTGHVISNRRLTAIFDEAKRRNDKTQLDEHVVENFQYTSPKKGMPRPKVSATKKEGKQLMRSVLHKVSEVVGPEESKIILALRDFIDEGRRQTPTRSKTDLEELIGNRNGLIDRLRSRRQNSVLGNNRYMSRLKLAGLYHDKFLMRLGNAITNNNRNKSFHPTFWKELNSGNPIGIDILKDFLHSQDATIPNTQKMKGFYRQLKSGKLFDATTKIKQLLKQRDNPDEEIYNFQSESVVKEDVDKIMAFKKVVVEKFMAVLDKFKDDTGYTTNNHETTIHNKIRGYTNRQLADIDFDEEFGDILETDIANVENLWDVLVEIREVITFISEKTNITVDISDIDNELFQEKMALTLSISEYDKYIDSNKILRDKLEAGERTNITMEMRERQSVTTMDSHKKSYLNLKRIQAEIPNKGFNKLRTASKIERNKQQLEEVKQDIADEFEDLQEKDEIPDATQAYKEVIQELEERSRQELQGEEE